MPSTLLSPNSQARTHGAQYGNMPRSASSSSTETTAAREPGKRPNMTSAGHMTLEDVEAVNIQIRDLSVTVDTSPSWLEPATYPDLLRSMGKKSTGPRSKCLLDTVNAALNPGSLTAIVGGSGSGKTTLLNTMAERMVSKRLSQKGSVTFNGKKGIHSVRTAYVMQHDILLPTLTVRETLLYSANLRLPSSVSQRERERERIVDEVILELGLKDCANTRTGNSQHRGCSGGEKRRVSIGVQLLSNPSVLFLDEPTTGLDATSAYQLVRTLKTLAAKGRTIVTTIHQPRSEIWNLFDNLIMLTRGKPVFSAPMANCENWFAQLGHELPPFVNPAEFYVDLAAIDNRTAEREEQTTKRVQQLTDAWQRISTDVFKPLPAPAAGPGSGNETGKRQHAGFGRQVQVLTSRTIKVTMRDPMGSAGSLVEAILMGICMGYIFYAVPRDASGIRSRQGALYIALGLQGYLFLMYETYRMTIDIQTFDREHSEGYVTALPFILSRRLARLFTEDIPIPLIFSLIFYFMVGFEHDITQFLIFFAIMLVNHFLSVSLAMTTVATTRNFAGASLIGNVTYTLQSVACGFFIQSQSIPIYVRWTKWITYTFYGFAALCGNEFNGKFYDCPYDGGESNPSCAPYTGSFIVDNLGFPRDWVTIPAAAMVGFVLLFTLLPWIGFGFMPVEMTIGRSKTPEADLSVGKEKMKEQSARRVRGIDVALCDYGLSLHKRKLTGAKLPTKTIVNPVNATFQAGTVNVIMGPSGSGKTSLLNAMAQRLDGNMTTRYKLRGQLTFNGAVPSESVTRSVVSYVCQDDDALLPSLTVRETLRFSAGLRLPAHMSTQQKHDRAEEVLLQMGLKDCADNLVGSELVKGISGGEKRRVSIAVQILTDPRVLLLDEPTSGLDAFTASSILGVLHGLAGEGRTLILTIHQARSDLFNQFGNVLLLARGGSAAYAGPATDMLRYFADLGYQCPQHTNPADFALDLITVDLQAEAQEAASRDRVGQLITAWANWQLQRPDGSDPRQLSTADEADEKQMTETASPHRRDRTGQEGMLQSAGTGAAQSSLATPAELGAYVRQRATFSVAFPILMRRAIINFRRQPPLLLARTSQVVGLGVILALFFSPLGNDYASVQNRMGFLQEAGAFYFVGMLQNVAVYPAEREVFYREDDDGVYSVEAFLSVYSLLEFPFELICCLVFGVLAVFAVGFAWTVELYFVFVFCAFGIVSCGESLGIMFNTVFSHTGFAVNVVSVILGVAQMMAGILSTDMPMLFRVCNYISPVKYATAAMAKYSLAGVVFTCDDSQRDPASGACNISTGEQVLDLYKLNVSGPANLGALVAVVIIYRLVAWALLRVTRTKWKSVSEARQQRKVAAAAAA